MLEQARALAEARTAMEYELAQISKKALLEQTHVVDQMKQATYLELQHAVAASNDAAAL